MRSLQTIIADIEASRQDMIDATVEMISIPALAPINGGTGEGKKADYLITKTEGFDEVRRYDVPDLSDPSVRRSNIVAVKKGKKKGTVWIVAHMDVVPTGDESLWDTPPFSPSVRDGRIYGRGTEDDGQSVISSMFAARQFLGEDLNGMSLGVAWVADEETTSSCGIQYLLDKGIFTEDDVIIVPDYCTKDGARIDVAEKHILWLKFAVEGKTTHASTPHLGINAYRVSTSLLTDLLKTFEERFSNGSDIYLPRKSTFEPTKRIATVENINTIPGYDEFCMDIRLNPDYRPQDVLDAAEEVCRAYEASTGAKISVETVQMSVAGVPSDTDTEGYRAFAKSIEEVMGIVPVPVGIAGGTCSNFFRLKGLNAYAWQTGDGSLHAPNEYLVIDNLVNDTKVFATLFYKLCM
ncbi:MAG: M20 family metallo-hydrolase [Thermoplasmata archaeon]|nr:M20 family metallo-hydrolase [Thermoplasmata archaeon]